MHKTYGNCFCEICNKERVGGFTNALYEIGQISGVYVRPMEDHESALDADFYKKEINFAELTEIKNMVLALFPQFSTVKINIKAVDDKATHVYIVAHSDRR